MTAEEKVRQALIDAAAAKLDEIAATLRAVGGKR
jgi:hypothetical protein